uniref:CSON005868 protein n=1 Tax=Culicoides sonorensis TaxID=179676 RepID=A0A336LW50_CULSO
MQFSDQNYSIFSCSILNALEIDFEPPLPAKERLIEVDDDEEIIELDSNPNKFYRCKRCHKSFLDLTSFLLTCNHHIPGFQKLLYSIQRNETLKKSQKQGKISNQVIIAHRNDRKIPNEHQELLVCDWCGVSFGLRLSLRSHFKVHLNKLVQCQYCDGKFTRKKTLMRHISVIHEGGDKELKTFGNDRQAVNCIFCDRPFESINNLRMHENSHYSNQFQCPSCDVICKSEQILKKHQRKHLGLKHPCEICGALLNSLDSLRGHIKSMHTGTKYRCGVCGVEYKHRGNYNDHIAGHLDPASKICKICNFEWDSRRSCVEHTRKKHPEIKLDYAMPKVDPTDGEKMKILKLLIDALPRHNGKPNHLEVCMKGVCGTFNGTGLVKKKRIQGSKKVKSQEKSKDEQKLTDIHSTNQDHKMPTNSNKIPNSNVRKSSRIRERKDKKTQCTEIAENSNSPIITHKKLISGPKPNKKVKSNENQSQQIDDRALTEENRIFAPKKDTSFEEYDPNYDYTASEDIFANDFLEETGISNSPEISKSDSRPLKSGETLCLVCHQPTKAIKTHLEHYHSDPLLDRVCRICQKVAMCKRDLKEHVKLEHRKQFSAYQVEMMQKKYEIPKNLPQELYCVYCPAKFLSSNHLKFHIEILHSGRELILDRYDDGSTGVLCKICMKSYPSQDRKFLKRHVTSNHGHSLVDCVCFLCGECFTVKNYSKLHLKKQHDGMSVESYMKSCNKKIEKFKEENPEFQCDDCNHSFQDLSDLNFHREVCHDIKIEENEGDSIQKEEDKASVTFALKKEFEFGQILEFKCPVCPKTFTKQEVFDKHKEQHDFGLLYCAECKKHFSGISQKREHDAYRHGIGRKNYICDHCGEKMPRRKALLPHFQLKCPGFTERPKLKWDCFELRKLKKEEKEMKMIKLKKESYDRTNKRNNSKKRTVFPFSHGNAKRMCEICAKICCNDYRLMEHGRKEHGIIFPQYEELYRQDCQQKTCEDCGKVFSQLGHYIEHKKIHSINFVTCKTCGIVVKGQKTLARHELIHKPKSFKCDLCDMMFHQKRTMTVHKQEKHGSQQYKCKYCPLEFKYKATLHEHIKAHEVPNFLKCEICNKDYATRGCLRSHRKRIHPEIYGNIGSKSRHQRPQSWNQYLMQMEDEPITEIVEITGNENEIVKFNVEFLHENEEIV